LITMQENTRPALRGVSRVDDHAHLGADAQVDDRYVPIAPTNPVVSDPFLLLSEDWFSTRGFEWHPHRGVETVTLVLDGVLEHGDNLGNAGALTTGDVQWMTAGAGIIHRELAFRNERAHTLQLGVNLPAELKMVDTRYQDLPRESRPVLDDGGVRVEVISGSLDGVTSPALNHWPIHGSLVTLEPNQSHEYPLPGHDRAFFYVLAGEAAIAGRPVRGGQIAWSEPLLGSDDSVITLTTGNTDQAATIMIYSGQPIEQPVAMGGPFVMNTQVEIRQAFTDFRSGKFGQIPRQARLISL
jgi:quercetin 2,3-dioxygenase